MLMAAQRFAGLQALRRLLLKRVVEVEKAQELFASGLWLQAE